MKKVIKESQMGYFNEINERLHELGDASVYFDSDEKHITISINPQSVNRKEVIGLMEEFGYRYYDCGANGDRLMLSFVSEISESKKGRKKRINEGQIKAIVRESLKKALREDVGDSFYDEKDDYGNVGEIGQVRSYETGYNSLGSWEKEAEEEGMPLDKFIQWWFDEVNDGTMQFTWQTLGNGYGYKGHEICSFQNKITGGKVVVKEIYGQVMIDEYGPEGEGSGMSMSEGKKVRITRDTLRGMVSESIKRILNEKI